MQNATTTRLVLLALTRAADPRSKLASVPAVVSGLVGRGMTVGDAHAAILSTRVELRPESGVELLSSEARALCIPGPRGSILSYARVA